ncbi:hypothetical protein Slin15195_G070520 [Septoria linicola]|uniref:G-patch domain-containing protein n=1 Tax=Septoria linicola TaxID=215465 RepID=A0A9Q9ELS6_9PEZI|nr:hypothetical protein Slin15195_G070520 [Septoria linicola]
MSTKMNAEALLKAYGWSGSGSLDSHNGAESRGLSKPLLVSKKVDVLGVGLNKHAAVSDQWWMRAYDSGLKDLGTGKKSTLSEVREKGMFAGGLYGRFVKGESEGGTIQDWEQHKRKREDDDSGYESKGKRVKTEDEKKVKEDVSRRVDWVVDEARRRKLLEGDVKKSSKSQSAIAVYGEDAIAKFFEDAGLREGRDSSKTSIKQQKYSKEKQLRELKKSAKAFVISKLSPEERIQLESGNRSSDHKREAKRLVKSSAKAAKAAEKVAAKEAKATRKQQDLEMKAWEKGVTVEEYLQQKNEKRLAKGKIVSSSSADAADTPAFVVDTTGDATLAAKANQVVDAAGNVRYTMVDEIPIPLDPTIWEGIDVKKLPKRVREARRQWMENKRQAKKTASGAESTTEKPKSKNEKKIARQEALVMEILGKSRKAKKSGKTATIDGIQDVPLVVVTSKMPEPYTKEEMALARTVARRVLKEEKRKVKAAKA